MMMISVQINKCWGSTSHYTPKRVGADRELELMGCRTPDYPYLA
jgi:hypothetical protein